MATQTHPFASRVSTGGQAPSRARYWVIFFAVTLAILAYIDRVCISMAAPLISKDLGFDRKAMGGIFSAFALSYALFEIPGGYWGDRIGPRRVLMRIVLWWSAFTALTGGVWNWLSMWITRFLFGAGEAGCFPNLTKAFTIWLPGPERVRAQGIMWMFARWGGAFTPKLVVLVLAYMSWRWSFVLFGALGLVWAAAFYWWFRDSPADHPSVNAAERALLADGSANMASGDHSVPWGKFMASPTVWLLWAQYFLLSFPWYFYITWLPTYLKDGRKLDSDTVANYTILPLLFGGFGSFTCGIVSTLLAKRGVSVRLTRRLMACLGFFFAAVMLVVSINTADPLMAMVFMGLASFCNDLVMPGAWGACMDVGGKFAGTLAGSMNMMGNLAGAVAPLAAGVILDATNDNFNYILYVMAGAYLLGTLCWPFIDPVTPIRQED
jgi:sugar phosphate permease